MKRICLKVAYEGTAYCGWQVQPNGETIEGVLNQNLSELLQEEIQVTGASRTDAGVHSKGNIAIFDTNTRIPAEKIAYALNQRLPEDIVVQWSKEVASDWHPRHCNSKKTYEYRILNASMRDPEFRRTTYFCHHHLNLVEMQKAASYFLGEHDFKSFCSIHTQAETTVRTIYDLQITQDAHHIITIRVTGNGFLYNMVRIIAGTLIQVGEGRIVPQEIQGMIEAQNRQAAGPTAPACGLTMIGIEYEENY